MLLLRLLHVLQHDDGPHGLVLLLLFEFNLSALPVSLSQTQAAAQPPLHGCLWLLVLQGGQHCFILGF